VLAHDVGIDGHAVLQTPGERELVGEFEFAAEGDSPGDGGDAEGRVGEPFLDVVDGGVALDGGTEGEDEFLDAAVVDALQQVLDVELLRADAVERRDDAAEYVVGAVVLLGALDGDDIADVLDHADDLPSAEGAGADGAGVGVGDVVAVAAEADVGACA